MPVTTPFVTRAAAVAAVVKLPPLKVTTGGNVYPAPPLLIWKALTVVIDALLAQDYVSGLFVDDDLGTFPGTLPMSKINLKGLARTPRPSVVINFRSYATGCDSPVMCKPLNSNGVSSISVGIPIGRGEVS